MKVLVINAGSSSIKYQLIDMTNEHVMAKGMCDRIGIDGGNFKQTNFKGDTYKTEIDIPNHGEGIKLIVDALTCKEHGVIESMSEINAVGHRVVHGGEKFSGSVIIENTFSLNGMGKLYWAGLSNLDFELVLAIQMFYTIVALIGSLLMDISYGLVDPRVRVDK